MNPQFTKHIIDRLQQLLVRLRGLYDGFADGLDFKDPEEAEEEIDARLAKMCSFSSLG